MTKGKVLMINHDKVICGTWQFFNRVYNIASKSTKVDYVYRIIKTHDEYVQTLIDVNPDYVIYNWHFDRIFWLRESDIAENTKIKHYFIYHDGSMMKIYDKYLFFGAFDPNITDVPEDKRILLPRPLYTYSGNYPKNNTVTIGSFGFAFNHKKFHTIAPFVGRYFEKAVVNLHFTNPYFGDTPGNRIADIINLCNSSNLNKNIELNITTNFLDDDSLLNFLAGNDLNLFMYDKDYQNPGISSAIDYALSVKRPIAISDNMMFRHIAKDDILVNKSSLRDILHRGTKPLDQFYYDWSTNKFTKEMEDLFI